MRFDLAAGIEDAPAAAFDELRGQRLHLVRRLRDAERADIGESGHLGDGGAFAGIGERIVARPAFGGGKDERRRIGGVGRDVGDGRKLPAARDVIGRRGENEETGEHAERRRPCPAISAHPDDREGEHPEDHGQKREQHPRTERHDGRHEIEPARALREHSDDGDRNGKQAEPFRPDRGGGVRFIDHEVTGLLHSRASRKA